MSKYYTIDYNLDSLIPSIKTNSELYQNIFSIIYDNYDSIIFIGLFSDERYKYYNDLKRKISILNKLINKYETRYEIPYYEEELKAINHMIKEYNTDNCVLYKQTHPLIKFFSNITNNKNVIIVNVDDNPHNVPLALLKMKYDNFPHKINLLTDNSSKNDINNIKENIELYYKLHDDELKSCNKDVYIYHFLPFEYSSNKYTFYNINCLLDPLPKNGILMPENNGNEFMLYITEIVTEYNNIIIMNESTEINYIITPKTGVSRLYKSTFKEKVAVIKDIYYKFTKKKFDEDTEDIKKMLECIFANNSFLL
jgi:hypothetical protein